MKKKIVVWSFLLLIFITLIGFIVMASDSYIYDMKNDAEWAGFDSAVLVAIGGFVVFYELDLFYTVYYFLLKTKTITKSILNILANLSLFLIFVYGCLGNIFMWLRRYEGTIFILFLIYIIIRIICFIIYARSLEQEEEKPNEA